MRNIRKSKYEKKVHKIGHDHMVVMLLTKVTALTTEKLCDPMTPSERDATSFNSKLKNATGVAMYQN